MNLKKIMALAMVGLTMVAFTAGCGSDTKGKAELPKKVVIGLDDTFAPMGFRDDAGNLVGFDIDMAKEAAKRANIEVEFKPIDWESKEAELKSKHIDILWNGLTILEERQKNVLFSDGYLKEGQVIAVKPGSPIKSKADLDGKIVAVQQASTADYLIQKDGSDKKMKEIKKYGDYVNAFMDLELGRVDAIIVDGITGRYLSTKKPGQFVILPEVFGEELMGIGFRKEDTALRDKFNDIMNEMKKDGTAGKIAEKWFGTANVIYTGK